MKIQKLNQKKNDNFEKIYFDEFSKAISGQQIENLKRDDQNINEEYTLFDDLSIILKLHGLSKISQKCIQNLSQILKRSNISIKNRYEQFLQNLTSQDFLIIYQFVQKSGIYGQLNFQLVNDNWYKLKDISAIFESPVYYLLGTPIKEIQENYQPKKLNSQIKRQSKNEEDSLEPSCQKKVNSKYDISGQKQYFFEPQKTILNIEQKQKAEELKYTLQLLSNLLKVSYKELVLRMYQCSGDLNTLQNVFFNNQESLLWTREADNALKAYLEQNDIIEKQKLKAVLNGDEQIQKRKEWLYG
ncbi:unnamed protein product [Paramecium sonneborni]|uniref:Uncharacterized protein n=1 Tax=Paramecium sonneborni TaxID=65129 RepID=A0A8S1K9Z9_9CILI|nr:unnamed protein product [Paramecium sonneborni]